MKEGTPAFSHYRGKDRVEVDLVLEGLRGKDVGVEVKARATAHPDDLKGIASLKSGLGERFVCGIFPQDIDRVQKMAPGLFAMPARMLWKK